MVKLDRSHEQQKNVHSCFPCLTNVMNSKVITETQLGHENWNTDRFHSNFMDARNTCAEINARTLPSYFQSVLKLPIKPWHSSHSPIPASNIKSICALEEKEKQSHPAQQQIVHLWKSHVPLPWNCDELPLMCMDSQATFNRSSISRSFNDIAAPLLMQVSWIIKTHFKGNIHIQPSYDNFTSPYSGIAKYCIPCAKNIVACRIRASGYSSLRFCLYVGPLP